MSTFFICHLCLYDSTVQSWYFSYMCSFVSFLSVIIVDDSEAADLWLLNSCTVKNPSEDNFRNAIKRAQELDKHLVVAGCVPQGQPRHQSIKGISVIGVSTF